MIFIIYKVIFISWEIKINKNRTNKLLEKELIPQTENPDDFNTFGNLEEENKKESNELVPENNL